MYEADIKGGRPSIAPEKPMRAMLLPVLYGMRSERQLVEQVPTTPGSSVGPSRTRCGTTRSSARSWID
jgi:hypothetical protein